MLSGFTISSPSIEIVPRNIFRVTIPVILTKCVCTMSFFDGYSVRCSTQVPFIAKLLPSVICRRCSQRLRTQRAGLCGGNHLACPAPVQSRLGHQSPLKPEHPSKCPFEQSERTHPAIR